MIVMGEEARYKARFREGRMDSTQEREKPLLRVVNVEKSYGATSVLRGVNFKVRAGEIHALLGGNGAGKSTLIRIVTGLTGLDAGSIETASARTGASDPVIAVVHQELALLPELSVAENIGLVHARGGLSISRRAVMREIALKSLRLIDPHLADEIIDRPARRLSLHQGQIVEIARALSLGAEVLLLDEPTANLTAQETATLFAVLRRLVREEGIGIVFVSHRMKEIRQLCDVCTIIRDGQTVVDAAPVAALTDAEIVQNMGQPAHRAAEQASRRAAFQGRPGLTVGGADGTEIGVAAGTILGLAGAPAGPGGLIETLVGSARNTFWAIRAEDLPERFRSPAAAVKAGVGFVSGDRAAKGVLQQLPIIDNVLAARRVRSGALLVRSGEEAECRSLAAALKLKAGSIWDMPRSLSGGNQQKLLVARWLGLPLRLVVLEEPTRGVDIGTKRDIYALIRELAATGTIVVWWSTENVELIELCDEIFAFDSDGRPVGFLPAGSFNEDALAKLTGMAA